MHHSTIRSFQPQQNPPIQIKLPDGCLGDLQSTIRWKPVSKIVPRHSNTWKNTWFTKTEIHLRGSREQVDLFCKYLNRTTQTVMCGISYELWVTVYGIHLKQTTNTISKCAELKNMLCWLRPALSEGRSIAVTDEIIALVQLKVPKEGSRSRL